MPASVLLMDKMQLSAVDNIRLAGAFGSHIEPRYAMILGMIPDCPLDKVSAAGNAAGTGARIALLDRRTRREIERTVRGVEKIETAVEKRFQEYFVDAMAIPHKHDAFDHLSQAVKLPPRVEAAGSPEEGSRPRRRRRRA